MNARHLSKTSSHGTPPHIIEGGRNLMGGRIDLDPASSAFWNRRVRARRFYDERANGLIKPWFGNVFLNPPGDVTGGLVQAFWMRLVEQWVTRQIEQALWVGFSLEQFQVLQGLQADEHWPIALPSPLYFPTVIPSRRLHYQVKVNARTSERSRNPPHSSYVTWLPPLTYRGHCFADLSLKAELTALGEPATHARMFADHFGYLGTIARSIEA